jgi:RHS repeat-associated protein
LNVDGSTAAHFEYDAYGNTVVTANPSGVLFSYRFSTKPVDPLTGLYYYGYRWFDPMTGRWPSRDPIEEEGGVNLYGFVGNNGVNLIDRLGLITEEELWQKWLKENANDCEMLKKRARQFAENAKKWEEALRNAKTDEELRKAKKFYELYARRSRDIRKLLVVRCAVTRVAPYTVFLFIPGDSQQEKRPRIPVYTDPGVFPDPNDTQTPLFIDLISGPETIYQDGKCCWKICTVTRYIKSWWFGNTWQKHESHQFKIGCEESKCKK